MKYLKAFVLAMLAGISIGLGCIVFLSIENKIIGALLFTVGLFTICTFGFNLFTGKVCYIFQNDREYALSIPVIWLGNFAGTGIMAGIVSLTRISSISEKALSMCQIKMDDSLLSLFLLGFCCNLLIYIAVEEYKNNPHEVGKYLALFFGVAVFILSGFEHSVADMFYFWVSGTMGGKALLCLLIISLGNAAGGVTIPLLRRAVKK